MPAWTQSAPAQTPPPNGAKVHFINLKDGQEVISLFLSNSDCPAWASLRPGSKNQLPAIMARCHVISKLGNKPIGGITRAEMVEFLDGLNEACLLLAQSSHPDVRFRE